MNVLLIGSGGREHALAWALARSPLLSRLYVAPGNAGIAGLATLVALDVADHAAVIAFCRSAEIGFVVVGPEAPLVAGIVDALEAAGIRAFGPTREAAQLEGSKAFTKALCDEAGIPTAAWKRFDAAFAARAYVDARGAPIVVKADGLAAGKGVTVAATIREAHRAIDAIFAQPGACVVIEDVLEGEEASFFALSDGTLVVPFGSAQDHKRAYDDDTGPNTGGMGAYSPAPIVDAAMAERVMATIVRPTIAALARRGVPYRGVLFAGLMIGPAGPQLIEYNARFGDPECQVLMLRLDGDLLAILLATTDGTLDRVEIAWRDEAALAVVMAAENYPGDIAKGSEIRGLDRPAGEGVEIFHAATRAEDGRVLADGGRVLGVTALGDTVATAHTRAYAAVARIDWPEGRFRRDIGRRAVERERG